MQPPDKIKRLVDNFGDHREQYTSGSYNETQVRRDFIDPFFGALGWDMDNREGLAEAYRHVIHEDAIKIGGTTQGTRLWLSIWRPAEVFCRGKTTLCPYQGRHISRLPGAPIRMVRQPADLYPLPILKSSPYTIAA